MNVLADLYAHQAWADAEHWRALEACPAALADRAIRERLQHIHQVQRAFLWVVGDRKETLTLAEPDDFHDATALKAWGREYHADVETFLTSLSESRRREQVHVPWFNDPPLQLPIEEALLQAAMHSHYHRGQNATRLRELGGEPPATDLIVWYWLGRPVPRWK